MRKIIIQIAILVILWTLFFYLAFAYSAPIVINPGPEYVVRVGLNLRVLKVFYEKDNLILRYFSDDAKREFLGEQIFDKDNIKIHDSYLEGRGEFPKGFELRYRR
jgi:hypothetical protein